MPAPAPVTEVVERWAPRSVSPEVAAFARRLVSAAAPQSASRAKALLFAAGKFGAFGVAVGLPLDEDVLLTPSCIERFVASRFAGTPPTARTLRANLRFLARHARSNVAPGPVALSRERAKAPYSPAELASYLALADAQPTALRRARAGALIALGAGAGLIGGELRTVRGTDVVCRSGGVLVCVSGRRARAVPVLAPYHERLLGAATFFGARYLVAGTNPDAHNVTNPLIRSLSGGVDLPRLETPRLRSSYLVAMAEAIGLGAFMAAAGVTCSQRLGDLVAHLAPLDEAGAVALLGAGRR
jgi:integrase